MELAYSRGPSLGFLGGVDHQRLVVGRAPKHRGAYLGRVLEVGARSVVVVDDDDGRPWTGGLARATRARRRRPARRALGARGDARRLAPSPGLGVVFDAGHPEADEDGGPIFSVVELGPRRWQLGFGVPGPELTPRRGRRAGVGDLGSGAAPRRRAAGDDRADRPDRRGPDGPRPGRRTAGRHRHRRPGPRHRGHRARRSPRPGPAASTARSSPTSWAASAARASTSPTST
jgi:hypothetical protein